MNPGTPVNTPVLLVNGSNLNPKTTIFSAVLAFRATPPPVIPTGRDPEHPTQHPHRKGS
jgi:hypothetical protein